MYKGYTGDLTQEVLQDLVGILRPEFGGIPPPENQLGREKHQSIEVKTTEVQQVVNYDMPEFRGLQPKEQSHYNQELHPPGTAPVEIQQLQNLVNNIGARNNNLTQKEQFDQVSSDASNARESKPNSEISSEKSALTNKQDSLNAPINCGHENKRNLHEKIRDNVPFNPTSTALNKSCSPPVLQSTNSNPTHDNISDLATNISKYSMETERSAGENTSQSNTRQNPSNLDQLLASHIEGYGPKKAPGQSFRYIMNKKLSIPDMVESFNQKHPGQVQIDTSDMVQALKSNNVRLMFVSLSHSANQNTDSNNQKDSVIDDMKLLSVKDLQKLKTNIKSYKPYQGYIQLPNHLNIEYMVKKFNSNNAAGIKVTPKAYVQVMRAMKVRLRHSVW